MKLLLLILTPLICLLLIGPKVSAFDLFSHCVTEADGSKVCGPCASNPSTPSCSQASSQGGATTNRLTGTQSIIQDAADIVALITGLAAVIMILISAITMITSAGNTEAVTNSRRRILAAVIGLIIVALAWTIARFVTDNFIK